MAAAEVLTSSENVFYVYVHRRATDGSVFYVGKGKGYRVRRTDRNPHWRSIVAKHGYTWEIVKDGLSESEAIAEEIAMITHYGRDALCNLTDGGEGPSGRPMSERHKQAISRRHKGAKRPPEWRAAISASLKGKPCPEDQKAKISAKLKGQKLSEETRQRMSASGKGRKFTEEHRAKMRQSWADPERRKERGVAMQHDGTPIVCVETGREFQKIRDAVTWLREQRPAAGHSTVIRSCKSDNRTAYGFHWRYA